MLEATVRELKASSTYNTKNSKRLEISLENNREERKEGIPPRQQPGPIQNDTPHNRDTKNWTPGEQLYEIQTEESQSSIEVKINKLQYAGRIQHFYSNWEKLVKNNTVLSWVQGYKIPFNSIPYQKRPPKPPKLSEENEKLYCESISNLLKIGAIKHVKKCKHNFLRKKPNGMLRFILNLKKLNEFISPPHFKLEDTRTVKNLLSKNCWLASIDLKDAYFSVPIHKKHKKFIRFKYKNQLFECQCLPFGLCSALYVFTKSLKPVIALR